MHNEQRIFVHGTGVVPYGVLTIFLIAQGASALGAPAAFALTIVASIVTYLNFIFVNAVAVGGGFFAISHRSCIWLANTLGFLAWLFVVAALMCMFMGV